MRAAVKTQADAAAVVAAADSSLHYEEHHLTNCTPYHHQHYTAHHLQIKLRITLTGLGAKRETRIQGILGTTPQTLNLECRTLCRDLGALLDICIMFEPQLACHPCTRAMLQWSWQPSCVILAQGPCFNGPGNDLRTFRFVRVGCANMCKHAPPHASVPEGACLLHTRRAKVKQKIISRQLPERCRIIPSATLGQLSHASHICRSEHYIQWAFPS